MRQEIPGSPGEYGDGMEMHSMEERQRLQVRKAKVRKTRGVSEDMYGRPQREDEPTPMLNAQNAHSAHNGRPRTPDHAMYGGKGTKGKGSKKGKVSMSREIIFFDEG